MGFSSELCIELQTAAEPNVELTAALGLSPKQMIKNANGFPEQRVHRAKQSEEKSQSRLVISGRRDRGVSVGEGQGWVSEQRPPEVGTSAEYLAFTSRVDTA